MIFRRILILFLLNATILSAQNSFLEHIGTQDGLPFETIFSSLQDSKGYMWFSSSNGLARYDGNNWLHLTSEDGLPDNDILNMYEDSHGRIWFASFKGELSYYYDGKIYTDFASGSIKNGIKDYFEQSNGTIWINPLNNYLSSINKFVFNTYKNNLQLHRKGFVAEQNDSIFFIGKRSNFVFNGEHFELISDYYSNTINTTAYTYTDSSCVYLSNEGLVEVSNQKEKLLIPIKNIKNPRKVINVYLSNDGSIWLSTPSNGVHIYNKYHKGEYSYKSILKSKTISSVVEDRDGNIWLSTMNSGIYILPFYYPITNLYIIDNLDNISCFNYTKPDLWFGTSDGYLFHYNENEVKRINLNDYDRNSSASLNRVNEIVSYNNQKLVATDNGVFLIDQNNRLKLIPREKNYLYSPKKITAVKDDVIVSHGMGLLRLQYVNQQPKFVKIDVPYERIHTHTVVGDKIWYSSEDYLRSYNTINGKRSTLSYDSLGIKQRVKHLIPINDSVLVCSTNGEGIYVFNNNSIINHITLNDGLSSNSPSKVKLFNNELWVSSINGLDKLIWKHNQFVVDKSYNNEFGVNTSKLVDFYIHGDTISFCSKNIFCDFIEDNLASTSKAPILYVDEVRSNDSIINSDLIKINQNDDLLISASIINYNKSAKTNFQYRLKTSDKGKWLNTASPLIKLVSLAPGQYTFECRAKKNNSTWSEPIQIEIVVETFFWLHPLMKLLYFSILLVVVYTSIRKIYHSVNDKKIRELKDVYKIKSLEQQALQAMMNPHFIFNVLNSIQYFFAVNNPIKAQQKLSSFAKLIRMNLEITQEKFITIEDEIEYLELYLSLEKLRFDESFSYEITYSENVSIYDSNIPTMLIQPFVENAIWHGIMPQEGRGKVHISFMCNSYDLIIEILDNGVGYNPNKNKNKTHKSVGLKMTRKRLELMQEIYKQKFEYKIENIENSNSQESGTLVTITLPNSL